MDMHGLNLTEKVKIWIPTQVMWQNQMRGEIEGGVGGN